MEYLGFWVTRNVIKPINIKIEAISNIKPPTSKNRYKIYIGVIQYYRNIRPKQSHTLVTLTRLTYIKKKFKLTQVQQDEFDEIKRIVARDTLLIYPYFNKISKIHTNASAFQIGVVIIQKVEPIAFYSRKITES